MERLVKSDVKYRFVIDSAQSFKSEGRSDEWRVMFLIIIKGR
jgi:hypothetical protein